MQDNVFSQVDFGPLKEYLENDFEDLKQKIRFYLSNPQEYNKTVEACYTIGRKNHHSKENVEFMLKKILVSNA